MSLLLLFSATSATLRFRLSLDAKYQRDGSSSRRRCLSVDWLRLAGILLSISVQGAGLVTPRSCSTGLSVSSGVTSRSSPPPIADKAGMQVRRQGAKVKLHRK